MAALLHPELQNMKSCLAREGLLFGWTCCTCKVFTGCAKENLTHCRSCGHARCYEKEKEHV